MKVQIYYPKMLKEKILKDIKKENDRASNIRKKTTEGKIGKAFGFFGDHVNPVFRNGLYIIYEPYEVTDNSLKLKITMALECYMNETMLFKTIKSQFVRANGGKVKVRLLLDREEKTKK